MGYQLAPGSVGKKQYVDAKHQNEKQAVSNSLYLGFIIMAPRPKL
jgi:hypothetical protein